jgi:ribosome-associated protein
MDIKKLQGLVVDALEDVKAQDIRVFDTTHLTSMFDRIAIASGTSNRQTKALASSVRDSVKAAGGHIISMEGEGTGEWVLVDLGDMVVHIMQPAIRAYYRLEELWGEKEIKLGASTRSATSAKQTLVKASGHITKTAVKKPTGTKAPAKKVAPEKTRVTEAAATRAPVKKTAAKKAVAKKVVAKKSVAQKATIKKVVAKKTTPKKSAAQKTPARKAPARKTGSTARKTPASKTGATRRTTAKSGS